MEVAVLEVGLKSYFTCWVEKRKDVIDWARTFLAPFGREAQEHWTSVRVRHWFLTNRQKYFPTPAAPIPPAAAPIPPAADPLPPAAAPIPGGVESAQPAPIILAESDSQGQSAAPSSGPPTESDLQAPSAIPPQPHRSRPRVVSRQPPARSEIPQQVPEPSKIEKPKGPKMTIQFERVPYPHSGHSVVYLADDNDRVDLITFALNLPVGWASEYCSKVHFKATLSGSEVIFSHALKIFAPIPEEGGGGKPPHVFTLYFEGALKPHVLYATFDAYAACAAEFAVCPKTRAFLLPVRPNAMEEVRQFRHHPYTVLGQNLHGLKLADETTELVGVWDQKVVKRVNARVDRDKTNRNIIKAIHVQQKGTGRDLRGRSAVTVKTTKAKCVKMYKYSKGRRIFRLVWVFPHMVALLKDKKACCVSGDGTFKALKPYTLLMLNVVIANEAIPAAFCVSPSESKDAMDDLYSACLLELKRNNLPDDLLTGLPFLSDQGPAMMAFVRGRGLKWILCHRHLIEKAGASSIVGSWVARLLRCCSLEEYERVRSVIIEEVRMNFPTGTTGDFPEGFHKVELMLRLYSVEPDVPCDPTTYAFQTAHWARWDPRRIGCPTTSNCTESIHAKLNALKKTRARFFTQLKVVIDYCEQRFQNRNNLVRIGARASRRFYMKLKSDRGGAILKRSRDPGLLNFYFRLNTPHASGVVLLSEEMDEETVNATIDYNAELLIKWQFEKHDLDNEVKSPVDGVEGVIEEEVDSDPTKLSIPNSWQPLYEKEFKQAPPAAVDAPVDADPLAIMLSDDDSAMPNQFQASDKLIYNTTWDIIFSIRSMIPTVWKRRLHEIILQTAEIGQGLQSNNVDVTLPPGEAQWRTEAYRAAHCPIVPKRRSCPAQPFVISQPWGN
jgi:hypothetical protein